MRAAGVTLLPGVPQLDLVGLIGISDLGAVFRRIRAIRTVLAIVGSAVTSLLRRLPGVVGIPELAAGEVVEPVLLGARDLELICALSRVGVDVGVIVRFGIRSIAGCRAAAEDPAQEAHGPILPREVLDPGGGRPPRPRV